MSQSKSDPRDAAQEQRVREFLGLGNKPQQLKYSRPEQLTLMRQCARSRPPVHLHALNRYDGLVLCLRDDGSELYGDWANLLGLLALPKYYALSVFDCLKSAKCRWETAVEPRTFLRSAAVRYGRDRYHLNPSALRNRRQKLDAQVARAARF